MKRVLWVALISLGCNNILSTPTTVNSPKPSPSPSPSASPVAVFDPCKQTGVRVVIFADNGTQIVSWGLGEIPTASAVPVNERGTPLDGSACAFPRVAAWDVAGASCVTQGDIFGMEPRLRCLSTGDVTVTVRHANHIGVFRGRVLPFGFAAESAPEDQWVTANGKRGEAPKKVQ